MYAWPTLSPHILREYPLTRGLISPGHLASPSLLLLNGQLFLCCPGLTPQGPGFRHREGRPGSDVGTLSHLGMMSTQDHVPNAQ